MATAADPEPTLNIREQIARIDKLQAELAKLQVDTKLAVWPIVTGGVTAAAALFGAGFAFAKFFVG